MNIRLKRDLLLPTLMACLLSSISLPSAAFDFKSAVKEAVKKQIDPNSEPASDAPASTASTANDSITPSANATAEPAEPTINWKNPSKAEEIALGREITGNLLGAAPLVKDEALQKYINSVGRWVASQSDRPDLPWHFGVIESDDLNAFAAPGGYVMVTKGLYRKLTNEAQLAGVLGHEIGHIVKKHQLKVYKNNSY